MHGFERYGRKRGIYYYPLYIYVHLGENILQ
jgi:hypothetical protein